MKAVLALLALFCTTVGSLQAEEAKPAPRLSEGSYLLVYTTPVPGAESRLNHLRIKLTKKPDGTLGLWCAQAPASPEFVFQQKTIFQFTIFHPPVWNDDNKTGGPGAVLCFVGGPELFKEPGVFEGTVAETNIDHGDSTPTAPATAGTFVLYKLEP